MRKWKKAVRNTQTFKDNKALSKTNTFAEYLVKDEELWARSFEQYVARTTTSNKMKKDFYIKKRQDTDIQRYWSDGEFELIHRKIDDIMRNEGILKHGK